MKKRKSPLDWRDKIGAGDILQTLAGDREVISTSYIKKRLSIIGMKKIRNHWGIGDITHYTRSDIKYMGMQPKKENNS